MPRKSKERRAAKRKHEEEDEASTSKRINVESSLHQSLKPKAGNLAANRLNALRKRLCDSLARTSDKPAKPSQSTPSAVCAPGTTSPREQFRKYPMETAIMRLEASRRKPNGTVIVIDDSPSPAKDKRQGQFEDSPRGFIVLSEAEDSDRNETPLASANERLRRFRNNSVSLSSTSSSKTLTPDSGEELNCSVVYVKTSRAAILPKADLFKSPEHVDVVKERATDVERLQETPAKSHANVPRIAEAEQPGTANLIPKKSPVSETGSSGMGNRRVALNNEIGANSSTGKTVKSSLADRLAKIRSSKAPIERTSATVDEAASEDILKCASISRAALVEEWMDSGRPTASGHQSMSDSLEVHLNDTILGRSELLSESQAESMDWDEIPDASNTPCAPRALPDEAKRNVICLVTDTNVFMHDLPKVQEVLNFKIVGNQKLIIYIPWMVLKELDHFKDNSSRNSSIKSQALAAQKLINAALLEPNSKVIGQSVNDVCQQMDLGKDPDDKILASCLQAKAKYTTVVLLSNDINLRNKALTNDLKTYSPRELVAKLKCNKFVKIKVKLQGLLSQIVFQCCKEVYGDACSKMEMLQNCPWSFEGCLKRFRRYWGTVFKELLLKHCLKTVEELIRITDRGDVADSNSSEFDRFKNKVKELLFFLQDIDKYNAAAKKMRVEMDNIGEDDCIL